MRQTCESITEYLLPAKIALCSENVKNPEALLKEKPHQTYPGQDACATINGSGFIVLDFGRELCGGIRILTAQVFSETHLAKVNIRFGESLSECCAALGEKNTTNNHAVRDFEYQLPSLSDITVGGTGFRFVRIDFLEESVVTILNIFAAFVHANIDRTGRFECNDQMLNKIYDTAVNTAFLNIQNGVLWDGIKRDRLVWCADLNPAINTVMCAFGDVDCIRNSITFIRDTNPLPGHINNIPSYSLWWIINLYDYFMYSGDIEFLQKNMEYAEGLWQQKDTIFNPNGEDNEMQYFLDWPTCHTEAAKLGVAALVRLCGDRITKLRRFVGANDRDESFVLPVTIPVQETLLPKQVLALRSIVGEGDPDIIAQLIAANESEGFSTFMSLYMLRALAGGGFYSEALHIIKQYFGGMLKRGATTFWEDFNVAWLDGSGRIDQLPADHVTDLHGDYGDHCYKGFRHSLCHAWASGPAAFLIESVLGITVLEPGCRKLLIDPHLGTLEYANGCFPTPLGNVVVNHTLRDSDGRVDTRVSAPDGIEIVYGKKK